jgi:hypothetical protein
LAVCPGITVALDEDDGVKEKSCPIPVSGTVWGLSLALSVTVRIPFLVPLAVGSKNTPMEQLAPGATLFPQLLKAAKSAGLAATLVIVSVALPVFFSITFCGSPDVPTNWLGNVTLDGDNVTGMMPVPVKGTV